MLEGFDIVIGEYLLKLLEPRALISLLTVLLLGGILFVIGRKPGYYTTKMLSYGALAVSAAFLLSYVRLVRLPNAGSITLASMLPIFIFAYLAGPRAGLMVGMCYGMLQFIQDYYFVHWTQFLLDYPLAFAMLGLAGFFGDRLYIGAIVGSAMRFVCHFLSGVVFFAEYANGQNVFLYSLLYNGSYILPDLAICLAVLAVPKVWAAIKHIKQTSGFGGKLQTPHSA